MNKLLLTNVLMYAEPALCLAALVAMYLRSSLKTFGFVSGFLVVRILSEAIGIWLLLSNESRWLGQAAYKTYFYVYWLSYAVEAALGFGIIYSIYNLAMAPLPGLQRLGRLMFRWAAGISLALAVSLAFGPHATGMAFAVRFISQLQQTQSVLTLCMLLFVCLTIRPMGLSHRSKIFGVSMGLGILAATELVRSAWLANNKDMVSISNLVGSIAIVATLSVWTAYFVLPEPRRRMIVLPTTSPFLRWNQISIALGDEPGFVALGDIHPDMFAPAEVEIMRRASVKMDALANPVPELEAALV